METPIRPVFVLGGSFSGRNTLAWALGQHPNLLHVLDSRWLVTLARELETAYASATATPSKSQLSAQSISPARFYESFGGVAHDLLLSHGATAESARGWVDSTPGHAFNVAGLLRLFPQAKFIHVIDDVSSAVRALVHCSDTDGTRYSERSAYEYWLKVTKSIVDAETVFGSQAILRVRFADLKNDPEATIRHCLEFVELPFDPNCLRPSFSDPVEEGFASYRIQESSSLRQDAELLSRILLAESWPKYQADPEGAARLDRTFSMQQTSFPVEAPRPAPGDMQKSTTGNKKARHKLLVGQIQRVASKVLPVDAKVLVISKGEAELLMIPGRTASHFPQNKEGVNAGYHPKDSSDAVRQLETLRAKGNDFLIIPWPYIWWLDFYEGFAAHLDQNYRLIHREEGVCLIFGPPDFRTTSGSSGEQKREPFATAPDSNGHGGRPERYKTKVQDSPSLVTCLARRLWGGFSSHAKDDLEAILRDPSTPTRQRINAGWEVARWYAVQEDHQQVLRLLRLVVNLDSLKRYNKRYLILEVRSQLRTGNLRAANSLLASGMTHYGYDTDLCLLSSNALLEESLLAGTPGSTDQERLAVLNHIFRTHGLHQVRTTDPTRPLSIHNISALPPNSIRSSGPKVTVIMPAHNAAATIGFALAGLREQTWGNLEVIVVDDASTDSTPEVVSAIAAQDDRIKLIRLDENGGAYVARNTGLYAATGDYITVHDSDDWSHSQKIEKQVEHILEQRLPATISCLVRASQDLRFNGAWSPRAQILSNNHSSIMVPTDLIKSLGGWDPVRTGADSELKTRLETTLGVLRLPVITPDVPYSFSLDDGASLTRRRLTHISSIEFGLRHEYHRAYRRWHSLAMQSGDLRLEPDSKTPRKFPAPAAILSADAGSRRHDLVFISDFATHGELFDSVYAEIVAALRDGRRVGVFHWPHYKLGVSRCLNERLALLIDQFQVEVVVADQEVTTTDLVFYGASALQHRLDRVPQFKFERILVIADDSLIQESSGRDLSYDRSTVEENLRALFGSAGEWLPSYSGVREPIPR